MNAPPRNAQPPGTARAIDRAWLARAPDLVARDLLGALIERDWNGETLRGRIVETEAYFGVDDPAAHAAAGRTPRNSVLWGPPGHAYVYFIYGMHQCLNVSCEPAGQAGCVLIRALEPMAGLDAMARLRGFSPGVGWKPAMLTSGPGRLCRALAITRAQCNGLDLLDPASPLRLAGGDVPVGEVRVTPRVGITKAAERLLRFSLQGHACVSGPRRVRGG